MNIVKVGLGVSKETKIGIIVTRFNSFVNDRLLDGATDTLIRIGGVSKRNISIFWIPGSFEIPLTIQVLMKKKRYDAIVVLATIIKGSTNHHHYISSVCSSQISNLSLKYNVPVSFGVLTTESISQSIERSGMKHGNKGVEAASAALEMINVIVQINEKI